MTVVFIPHSIVLYLRGTIFSDPEIVVQDVLTNRAYNERKSQKYPRRVMGTLSPDSRCRLRLGSCKNVQKPHHAHGTATR